MKETVEYLINFDITVYDIASIILLGILFSFIFFYAMYSLYRHNYHCNRENYISRHQREKRMNKIQEIEDYSINASNNLRS